MKLSENRDQATYENDLQIISAGIENNESASKPLLPPGDANYWLTLFADMVNSAHLDMISSVATAFADQTEQKTTQLVAVSNKNWSQFITQLSDVTASFHTKDNMFVQAIKGFLKRSGSLGKLSTKAKEGLWSLSAGADAFARAAGMTYNLATADLGTMNATELLITLNETMYHGMALTQRGTDKLDSAFVDFRVMVNQSLSLQSNLTDNVVSSVKAAMNSSGITVRTLHSQIDRSTMTQVLGVDKASSNAISTLLAVDQQSSPHSGAPTGFRPLIAIVLAVGAAAFP
jgi:hypothetical protein